MNETSFELILHSGNSKSSSMEAIEYARQGNIQEADFKMNEAQEELLLAHKIQSKLLAKSAKVDHFNPNMLLVHAQDHLCGAQTQLEMAKEIISLYEQVQEIKTYLGIENFQKQKNMRVLLVCGQDVNKFVSTNNVFIC